MISKTLNELDLIQKELKLSKPKRERTHLRFSDMDHFLFQEGSHYQVYEKLGAKVVRDGAAVLGTYFSVFAPHAKAVGVAGDFNGWDGSRHQMSGEKGIWTLFIPKLQAGALYKFEIETQQGDILLKADPYGYYSQLRPDTASVVYELDGFQWSDQSWLEKRSQTNVFESPLNIYEMHLGSWKRTPDLQEEETFFSYADITDELIQYVLDHSYTHIELMPMYEHPFDGSWGYQATGYFAASSRYGEPKDLMTFIDRCHQAGIGVLMDWVPGHFCRDAHGLYQFDGGPVYEYPYEDIAVSEWGTANFDLGRGEVHSFLISNALFWMRHYHVDGFRVDAVANMIYWDGNKARGENPNAVRFLGKMNQAIRQEDAGVMVIAEDSTSYPKVTAPVEYGGLGFTYKWNMGWMNDTLRYHKLDHHQRGDFHQLLSFAMMYAYNENFVLPFSHDEIVHGKRSLVDKSQGDYWQKMAQYRLLMTYQMTLPGKKLNFMTNEIAQYHEWKDKEEMDWHLFAFPAHDAANRYIKDLNRVYRNEKALWELDHNEMGFEWIDVNNTQQSIYSFVRRGREEGELLVIVLNFRPYAYHDYAIGVPKAGTYQEILNSDTNFYHGSHVIQEGLLEAHEGMTHGKPYHVSMSVPPFGASILKWVSAKKKTPLKTESTFRESPRQEAAQDPKAAPAVLGAEASSDQEAAVSASSPDKAQAAGAAAGSAAMSQTGALSATGKLETGPEAAEALSQRPPLTAKPEAAEALPQRPPLTAEPEAAEALPQGSALTEEPEAAEALSQGSLLTAKPEAAEALSETSGTLSSKPALSGLDLQESDQALMLEIESIVAKLQPKIEEYIQEADQIKGLPTFKEVDDTYLSQLILEKWDLQMENFAKEINKKPFTIESELQEERVVSQLLRAIKEKFNINQK